MDNDTLPPNLNPGTESAVDVITSDGQPPVAQPRCAARPQAPFWRWPCTVATMVLAVPVSIAGFAECDVGFLYADTHVWGGQFWRLLTSCLLHAHPLHLIFNLYWLAELGQPIELRLGSSRTALLFAVLGLGSSAAQFLTDGVGGIGLSGVGYGCFGLLWAVRHSSRWPQYTLPPRIIKLFVGWFFFCILLTASGTIAIGNAAHGAGLALGFVIGRAMISERPHRWVSATVAATGLLVLATLYMPWAYNWWWYRSAVAFNRHDLDNSLCYATKAVHQAGDDSLVAPLLPSIASAYLYRREYDLAIAWQQRAVRTSQEPKKEQARLARIYWYKGDTPKATDLARPLVSEDLELVPDVPEFIEFVSQVQKATASAPATSGVAD